MVRTSNKNNKMCRECCIKMRMDGKENYIFNKRQMEKASDYYIRKRYLALTNISAGIYNRDKKTFDKGQRQLQKYCLELLEKITEKSQTEKVSGHLYDIDTGERKYYENENWILELSNSMKNDHDDNVTELNKKLEIIEYWEEDF